MLGVETSEIGATLIALSIPGAKQLYNYLFRRRRPGTNIDSSNNYQRSGVSAEHGGTILNTLRRNHHSALQSQENQGSYETEVSAEGDNHRGSQDRIYVKVDVQVDERHVTP